MKEEIDKLIGPSLGIVTEEEKMGGVQRRRRAWTGRIGMDLPKSQVDCEYVNKLRRGKAADGRDVLVTGFLTGAGCQGNFP